MITRADVRTLRKAPPYTILSKDRVTEIRAPKRAKREYWEIFEIDGGAVFSHCDESFTLEMYRETLEEISQSEPQRCDDTAPKWFTDEHAALCALQAGYSLIKLWDAGSMDHYRWYVCTEKPLCRKRSTKKRKAA